MIPIYKPYISKYKKSAKAAINDEWISNHGIYTDLASEKLKTILGVNYCILMNNGTAATHCIYMALKYKYPTINKIYVPNNVFIAVWNCGLMVYDASVFEVVKTNPNTLNMDTSESYINTLDTGAAVVIVHNLGNVVNVPRLKRLRPDLVFIEDNCEGIFGKYEGVYTGSCDGTLASSVSFYGNKTITTGEGGAFFTNDLSVYKYIKSVQNHGMTPERYIHDTIAYNYRMTNIQAAFLYDQLSDLRHILNKKSRIFSNYTHQLSDVNNAIHENETEHSTWMFSLILPGLIYSDVEKYMDEKNIQTRPLFYDIHEHVHLKCIKSPHDKIDTTGFMIPSFPDLSKQQQQYIVNCINDFINVNHIRKTRS